MPKNGKPGAVQAKNKFSRAGIDASGRTMTEGGQKRKRAAKASLVIKIPLRWTAKTIAGYRGKESGGFSEPSLAYKNNPSIENYVKLRRADSAAEIEVAVVGGIDSLFFMETELRKYGFDPLMIAGVLESNPAYISEVCLQILEKMIEAKKRAKAGETHLIRRGLAIPDKLVDWLIACMLDHLSWNDQLNIPRDLIVLIRERLGGSNLGYAQASDAYENRKQAILMGGQIRAKGGIPTIRSLARILKVEPSTVSRWFPDGDFQKKIQEAATWFDEKGKIRPLPPFKLPLRTK